MTAPLTPEQVADVLDDAADEAPFVGSMLLMDALAETVDAHVSFVEVPDSRAIPPYIWCSCGWRSDDRGFDQESAQRGFNTHLTNELHGAAVVALRTRQERRAAAKAQRGRSPA